MSELENIGIEIIQNETMRKKVNRKNEHSINESRSTSSSKIYLCVCVCLLIYLCNI